MQTSVFQAEIEEIQKHRLVESKKAGHDVGEEWAARDWTEKYAAQFRDNWDREMQAKGGVH